MGSLTRHLGVLLLWGQVVQLKDLLRKLSLPVTGKKDVLIERLKTSRLVDHATSPSPSSPSSVMAEEGNGDAVRVVDDDSRGNNAHHYRGDTEGSLPTPDADSRDSGAKKQGTLRERVEARVRARALAREGEATRNRVYDEVVKAAVGSTGSLLRPPGRSRLLVQDSSRAAAVVPSSQGTSQDEATKSKKSSKVSAGSSMARKPLGVLAQGNTPRVESSVNIRNVARDLSDFKEMKEKKSESLVALKAEGSSSDAHARTAFVSGTSKNKSNSGGGAGPKRVQTAIASGGKRPDGSGTGGDKSERSRFSGSGGGSSCGVRHGSSEGVDENASREAKPSGGGHRRSKSVVAVKTAVKHVPSFLKPTKSSGAHTSAAIKARSGGGS